jgi:hypothetical protein
MTLSNSQVTLGTVAELVCAADRNPQRVYLHNQETGTSKLIFFGGEGVSASNGIHLDSGESAYLMLNRGEALYAMSNPDACVLGILRQKADQ